MERDLFKDHATVLRDHFLNEWSRNSSFLVSEKQKMMMVSGGRFKKKSSYLSWRPVHFQKIMLEPPFF